MGDRAIQPGFVRSVMQALSGSRFRTPESPKGSTLDSIRRDEGRQDDQAPLTGLTPDEVILADETTDGTGLSNEGPPKSFRYNGGSPTLTNGSPSSGFRYFKNEDMTKSGGGVSQGKGLMSSSPCSGSEQGKMDKLLPDPSSFPLSRPMAGYVSDHSKEPRYSGTLSSSRDHAFLGENVENLSIARMGQWDPQHVTHRDSKRPKERSRDKAYKQRFSMGSSGVLEYRQNVVFQTAADSGIPGAGNPSFKNTPAPSGFGHGSGPDFLPPSPVRRGDSQCPEGS